MGRYTGPRCRQCRREGEKICDNAKCALTRRKYAPGDAGARQQRPRLTEYGTQLRAKQKARRIYGIFERQFQNLYNAASKTQGDTSENLLKSLELRLDNVVYRMGLASSRPAARQLVTHGHVLVNGKKVNVPSYRARMGEEISLKERMAARDHFVQLKKMIEKHTTPVWLSLDPKELKAKIVAEPSMESVDHALDLRMIVEYYSR